MAPNKTITPLPDTPMSSHALPSAALEVDICSAVPSSLSSIPPSAAQIAFVRGGDVDVDMDMYTNNEYEDYDMHTARASPVTPALNMPSTPPAMAGLPSSPAAAALGDAAELPAPPAYSTLANSDRTFHLAPLLEGVPGEVELQTSDGKRFLVHKSVLEKETVFFHIYYGFVPAWRLNLSLEESVGLPPNPHVPSVIMDAPANLPPPPPFSAQSRPTTRRGSRNNTSSISVTGSNVNSGNALGLSGLWALPKIITNVCASATAAASGVVAGSNAPSTSSRSAPTLRRPRIGVNGSSSSRSSSIDGSEECAPLLARESMDEDAAPTIPPKDEPESPAVPTGAVRRIAAPPPPPPCAPTPTTSPYVWTVPEPSSILYAFLCLIYPPGTLAPSPTCGLSSINTCTRVIRAAMGYQSNKAISLARAHLWGYLHRLEVEAEEDRFWAVQQQKQQQRGSKVFSKTPREEMHAYERKRTLDRQAVKVYALASYFKFTDLSILASRTACRVPRDEWTRADVTMMGRRAASRLASLQEIRTGMICQTVEAAHKEHIMASHCPACAEKREMTHQLFTARCTQVSEAAVDAQGAMDAEVVGKMLLDLSEAGLTQSEQSEGCVSCMQEYGRCVGLVMGVLSGMPDSVAVLE